MTVDMFEDHSPDVDITFTREDLRDVVPHDNDPIVISFCYGGKEGPQGTGEPRKLGRCNVLADFHKVAVAP